MSELVVSPRGLLNRGGEGKVGLKRKGPSLLS